MSWIWRENSYNVLSCWEHSWDFAKMQGFLSSKSSQYTSQYSQWSQGTYDCFNSCIKSFDNIWHTQNIESSKKLGRKEKNTTKTPEENMYNTMHNNESVVFSLETSSRPGWLYWLEVLDYAIKQEKESENTKIGKENVSDLYMKTAQIRTFKWVCQNDMRWINLFLVGNQQFTVFLLQLSQYLSGIGSRMSHRC